MGKVVLPAPPIGRILAGYNNVKEILTACITQFPIRMKVLKLDLDTIIIKICSKYYSFR